MIKAEVCNNMFTINVSAVFPSKYGCRNSPWRPLCSPYPPESFALLFPAAIGNYVGEGEMQLCLTVTLAQPGRKQKGPGEWEGIKLRTLQPQFLDLNETETPHRSYL